MQLNYLLSFALALLAVLPLKSMNNETKYKGTKGLEKKVIKSVKERECERQARRYYKEQTQDLIDPEYGEYETKAFEELQRRTDKKTRK